MTWKEIFKDAMPWLLIGSSLPLLLVFGVVGILQLLS